MSHVLKGGLGNNRGGNHEVLEQVAEKMASQKEIRLKFPNKARGSSEDGRMDARELAEYVDDLADGAFEWTSKVAGPFLRGLDRDIADIGEEVQHDLCEDGDDTREERKADYESTLHALRRFSPQNDGILREEATIPGREKFLEALCLRVRQKTELGALVDKIRHAPSKQLLEEYLKNEVFFPSNDKKAPIRAFNRGYKLADGAFGRYYDFAVERLGEATSSRSRELVVNHKLSLKKKKKEVLSGADTDVDPKDFFFGEAEDKTTLLNWKHQGRENAIRLQRSGDRLYVVGAWGKPEETLKVLQEGYGEEPFIPFEAFLDKEDPKSLCPAKPAEGEGKYVFGVYLNPNFVSMARWIRTGAGVCMFQQQNVSAAEEFYFQKEAGTIVVCLPQGFILSLPEVKDENHALVAPERKVELRKPTKIGIRRTVVNGVSRIVLESCDNEEAMEELRLNGVPGIPWKETGQKGWKGLPQPIPAVLSFGYKLACQSGELKPRNR